MERGATASAPGISRLTRHYLAPHCSTVSTATSKRGAKGRRPSRRAVKCREGRGELRRSTTTRCISAECDTADGVLVGRESRENVVSGYQSGRRHNHRRGEGREEPSSSKLSCVRPSEDKHTPALRCDATTPQRQERVSVLHPTTRGAREERGLHSPSRG